MAQRTVHELAHALSDSERKELLERIQRSLSLAKKDQPAIYRTPVSPDYRSQMIQQGLGELGFFQRISLWLKRILSGKSEEEAYLDLRMEEIARHVSSSRIADPDSRQIRPELAEQVWKLYAKTAPLVPFFNHLWGSEQNMRDAIQYVLSQKIPNAKRSIGDYIKPEEMESLYEASESKNGLRQELLNRLARYLETIPVEVFSGIEEGLMPLYYLKEVCSFDYAGFLRCFQVDIRGLSGSPAFKPASVDRVIDELEHLYYALHTARKGGGDQLHHELFDYYRQQKPARPAQDAALGMLEPSPLEAPPVEPAAPPPAASELEREAAAALGKAVAENQDEGLKTLRRELRDLRKEIDAILENARLADIIRLFRNDPYYKFLAYVPSLNLRDFFYASTRIQLMEALDAEFPRLRRRVVDRLVAQVLKQGRKDFENYRRDILGLGRQGLPVFRYVDSLSIIYNYLGQVFLPIARESIRILMKVLPARNRDSSGELTFHLNGMESLHEKIKILDHAFAQENAEGKNILRFRNNIERDLSQEKSFRIYVSQKDKEFKALLEEGIDHLRSLSETIDDILRGPAEMLNERLQSASGITVPGGWHGRFTQVSRDMKLIQRAARYQKALEEETL